MPKNQVQFQKGQSLRDFLKLYGTDQQCAQALFQSRWPEGFRCPACGISTVSCTLARSSSASAASIRPR